MPPSPVLSSSASPSSSFFLHSPPFSPTFPLVFSLPNSLPSPLATKLHPNPSPFPSSTPQKPLPLYPSFNFPLCATHKNPTKPPTFGPSCCPLQYPESEKAHLMEDWGASSSFSSPLTSQNNRQPNRGGALFDCGEEGGDGVRGLLEGEFAAFSKPILVLDFVWNLAFVVVSAVVLLSTLEERPCTPLRLWVCGYGLQCMVHVVFVCVDYRRNHGVDDGVGFLSCGDHSRMFKSLDSTNSLFSSVWWALGFYWIVIGGQLLLQDSPRLYWLTVIFLAFDVFFVIFCMTLACLVFLALFCCIPLLAIAYAVTSVEGASEETIKSLPKYRYRSFDCGGVFDRKLPVYGPKRDRGILVLPPEDSECCICLQSYVDGTELSSLPCNHHFHSECIGKWLLINATCPLCKFSILRGDTLV